METPVLGLQAPDLKSAQVIVCPRGVETPQPDFGIDVGNPEAVDQAHARVHDRGLRVVYPLATEPWGVRRFFVRTPTAASSMSSRTSPTPPEHLSRARRTTCEESIDGPAALSYDYQRRTMRHRHIERRAPVEDPRARRRGRRASPCGAV